MGAIAFSKLEGFIRRAAETDHIGQAVGSGEEIKVKSTHATPCHAMPRAKTTGNVASSERNISSKLAYLLMGHGTVLRNDEHTTLTVDGVSQSRSSRGKEFLFGKFATNSDVFVGGMPNW
uniref:Uncharacterized protein n=1 Tax=Anopheles albimanus TaxID=7167 RepID=A0A182FQ88_ANOAL